MTIEQAIELQERAWTLESEGRLEEARAACREALRIIEGCEGADSLDTANILNDLADIEKGLQEFHAALTTTERALVIENTHAYTAKDETAARVRLRTLSSLGEILRTLGDYKGAEENLKHALAIAAAEFGEGSEESAHALNGLAVLYKYCGRFDEGIALYREALRAVVALHGERSLDTHTIYHNIGGILFSKGDFASADEPGRTAWEIARLHLGENDTRTMADAMAYAAILDGLERYDESEAIYRRALGVYEQEFGGEHYEVAATLHNLGAVLSVRGNYGEAEHHYRKALAIKEKVLGTDNPDVALSLINLGSLLNATERRTEAVPLLERAVAILGGKLVPGHPQLMLAREHLRKAMSGTGT
jgi:tetratricopeptide (TPR) repeat protein